MKNKKFVLQTQWNAKLRIQAQANIMRIIIWVDNMEHFSSTLQKLFLLLFWWWAAHIKAVFSVGSYWFWYINVYICDWSIKMAWFNAISTVFIWVLNVFVLYFGFVVFLIICWFHWWEKILNSDVFLFFCFICSIVLFVS